MRVSPLWACALLAILSVVVVHADTAAVTEKPEVVLEPGAAWRVYDAAGEAVSGVVVDDVIKGLDVIAWRVDASGGGVGKQETGSSAEATKAIEAELAKGATVASGHFVDRGHLDFTATKTYVTGGGAPAGGDKGKKAPAAGGAAGGPGGAPGGAGGPGGSGGGGPEAAGGPGGPGGPKAGGPGGAAKAGAAGAGGGEEGEKKGLPILPIGIGAVVVVAVLVFVMMKRKK